MKQSDFAEWFEAQFGPRSRDRYSDAELERESRAGKRATQELANRAAWDEKRTAALYAWAAAQRTALNENETRKMTTREHFAGMAMTAMINGDQINSESAVATSQLAKIREVSCAEITALLAIEYADALIAELARATEKSSLVEPDADGWIKHDPTGPVPENVSEVRFKDGLEVASGNWAFSKWRNTNCLESLHITHYKK